MNISIVHSGFFFVSVDISYQLIKDSEYSIWFLKEVVLFIFGTVVKFNYDAGGKVTPKRNWWYCITGSDLKMFHKINVNWFEEWENWKILYDMVHKILKDFKELSISVIN